MDRNKENQEMYKLISRFGDVYRNRKIGYHFPFINSRVNEPIFLFIELLLLLFQ